jgi:hypothetical protein
MNIRLISSDEEHEFEEYLEKLFSNLGLGVGFLKPLKVVMMSVAKLSFSKSFSCVVM